MRIKGVALAVSKTMIATPRATLGTIVEHQPSRTTRCCGKKPSNRPLYVPSNIFHRNFKCFPTVFKVDNGQSDIVACGGYRNVTIERVSRRNILGATLKQTNFWEFFLERL